MKANFTVSCSAAYTSHLDIPDKLIEKDKNGKLTEESKDNIAKYIQEHIPDCNIELGSLEWIADDESFGSDVTVSDNKEYEETFFVEYP